jgi:hypothetical protein
MIYITYMTLYYTIIYIKTSGSQSERGHTIIIIQSAIMYIIMCMILQVSLSDQ